MINNPRNTFFLTLPFVNPYQSIQLKILEDQKIGGSYSNAFSRNTTVLQLVNQIEKDIFEIKSNQAALQHMIQQMQPMQQIQPMQSMQPLAMPSWGQNGMAFAPIGRK